MKKQITKIELDMLNPDNNDRATLEITISDGSVYSFGCHETGVMLIKEKNRGLRPNKVDQQVFDVLSDNDNWRPPSHRDIAKIVGCHYSYIQKALSNLQRDGMIDLKMKPILSHIITRVEKGQDAS